MSRKRAGFLRRWCSQWLRPLDGPAATQRQAIWISPTASTATRRCTPFCRRPWWFARALRPRVVDGPAADRSLRWLALTVQLQHRALVTMRSAATDVLVAD